MPKKENKHIELTIAPIVVTAGLATYFYLNRLEDEYHNNIYTYPVPTVTQWTPIIFTQAACVITITTALILHIHPERTNYHPNQFQRIIDGAERVEPEVMTVLNTAVTSGAKFVFGERAEPVTDLITKGTVAAQQLIRLGIIHERLHEHKISRSIESDKEHMQIRRIEAVVQHIDEAVTYATEIAAEVLYRMMLSGFLSRYLPDISKANQLAVLSGIYLVADAIETGIMYPISNFALATEIVIENRIISQMLHSLNLAGGEAITFPREDVFLTKVKDSFQQAETRIAETAVKFVKSAKSELKLIRDAAFREAKLLKAKSNDEAKRIIDEANAESRRIIDEANAFFKHLQDNAKAMSKQIKDSVEDAVEDLQDGIEKVENSIGIPHGNVHSRKDDPDHKHHFFGETLVNLGHKIADGITGHHHTSSNEASAHNKEPEKKKADDKKVDSGSTSGSNNNGAKHASLAQDSFAQQSDNILGNFKQKEIAQSNFTLKRSKNIEPKPEDEYKKARAEVEQSMQEGAVVKLSKPNDTTIIELPNPEYKLVMPFLLEGSPLDVALTGVTAFEGSGNNIFHHHFAGGGIIM